MAVFITGGHGHIASWTAYFLVKEGEEVRFVTFEVPSHPMEVKKETKICDRVYYAFERVK